MGTDLTVFEQTDFRVDSKGRTQYTVTEIHNFRPNAYKVMEYVSNLSGINNCSIVTVDARDFITGLQMMKDDMLFIEHDGEHYANEERELRNAIEDLESFIEENEIDNEIEWGERTFMVELSF